MRESLNNNQRNKNTSNNSGSRMHLKTTLDFIIELFQKISIDMVSVYSAQASFFMILSIFPIIMLLLNIIGHTTLPVSLIPELVNNYMPETVQPFLLQIISELQTASSGTIISITAVLAIWSASKGALAMIRGTRKIMNSSKPSNYFVLRFLSMIYTIILILAMVMALVLLVFGNSIFNHIKESYSFLQALTSVYTFGRYLLVMFLLSLFFLSLYKLGADKHYKYGDLLPGAMFTALGWMIFSYLFSIYVDNFSNFSYMYGSITAIIIIMLWMYFCMYIMFIGAEINEYLYKNN